MKIENAEQFDRLLRALALELTYANVHYKLFLDVNASFTEYQKEVQQSPAFWGITRDALKDVACLGLCRVYDPDHRTNSLPNALQFLQRNIDNHSGDQVYLHSSRTPSQSNPTTTSASVDPAQLKRDIEFASVSNAAVKRLITWRGNIFVHANARHIAHEKPLSSDKVPRYEDLQLLLENGMEIINRYAKILQSTEYSTQLVGGDDYKFVFDCVRQGLKHLDEQRDEELRAYGLDPIIFRRQGEPFA